MTEARVSCAALVMMTGWTDHLPQRRDAAHRLAQFSEAVRQVGLY
jgi:hypothetical protein